MREIKFRGYELDLKKWVYGGYHKHIKRQICPINDSLKEEDIQHLIIADGFADWNMPRNIQVAMNVDKNSIGQFTGLKDKNGKEIYEGDIVKVANEGNAIVYYDDKRGYFGIKYDENCKYSIYESCYHLLKNEYICEVIGNIYANKDLLEEK